MMTMSSAMTVSLTSCSNEDNISDIPSKLKIEDIDAELIRATDAQIKKYQEEADKWHGGADSDEVTVDLSKVESNFTAQNGMTLTGKLKANLNVTVAADAIVTLKDVTIDAGPNQPGIICLGVASIFVEGENNVKGAPGVTVQYDKAAINDIVFGRTPWFSAKFQSEEYENALKESPFVYPKN